MFRKMADKMTARSYLASIGKESISRERLFLAENCIEAKLFRTPFLHYIMPCLYEQFKFKAKSWGSNKNKQEAGVKKRMGGG